MNEKQTAQVDSIYKSIGEFTVHFNTACFLMQKGIKDLLQFKYGVKLEELYDLSAGDLAIKYKQYLEAGVALGSTDRKIINKFFNKVQQLIKDRNDISHGVHFVGYTSEKDGDCPEITTIRYPRQSTSINVIRNNIESLETLVDRSREIEDLSMRMWNSVVMCVVEPEKFGISSYFEIEKNGNLKATNEVRPKTI